MFRESQLLEREEDGEKGGIKAEGFVAEFLECHDDLFERVELTEKGGINDHNQIDAFVVLKGDGRELPCAIDFTGTRMEKLEEKYKRQDIVPLVSRHDENTGRAISELMPHFIIDGIDLAKWIDWGDRSDQDGVPIVDIIEEQDPELEKKLYKSMLAKMWVQARKLSRSSKSEQQIILPYKKLLEKQMEGYFTDKELEVLRSSAA